MRAMPGWHVLMSITPPAGPGALPAIDGNSILPVKLYVCSVCGYIETYAGAVTSPETWRGGK